MSSFSNRWGLPSCRQEESLRCRRGWRCGNAAPCRARLEGWIRNVAARSPIWGYVDLEAFCRKTGYSREHATRELSNIRRDRSDDLAFETKLRSKKGNPRKRWGVIVAERKKLRFDKRSLFYDVRGNRLHNRTKLGYDGTKIAPTATPFATAPRLRGRPRQMPVNADAVLEKWRSLADERTKPAETVQADRFCVSNSDKLCVSDSDKHSDKNHRVCDNAYRRKDSFGIQQKDLYGARRDVAQWRGSKERRSEKKSRSPLRKKAFALLKRLADCHWDNCKVIFARRTAYRFALKSLTDGHEEQRILSRYSDALFVCHGFAVDQAASTGKITFFNLSSTVTKAGQLLAKDGLSRDERVARWYRNHPRNNSDGVVSEVAPSDITRLRELIAASIRSSGDCKPECGSTKNSPPHESAWSAVSFTSTLSMKTASLDASAA
jgi:hypothetical protein